MTVVMSTLVNTPGIENCGVYLGEITSGVYLQGDNTGVGRPSCRVDTHTPLLFACGLWSTVMTAGCARCCACGNRAFSTALYSL